MFKYDINGMDFRCPNNISLVANFVKILGMDYWFVNTCMASTKNKTKVNLLLERNLEFFSRI